MKFVCPECKSFTQTLEGTTDPLILNPNTHILDICLECATPIIISIKNDKYHVAITPDQNTIRSVPNTNKHRRRSSHKQPPAAKFPTQKKTNNRNSPKPQ